MSFSSSSRRYDVFISHAGEDKDTIAKPFRNMLSERGITAFVDEKDIAPGAPATDVMTSAMENAYIAVIVLSPEFVAKKWPMKELLFFLNRRKQALAIGSSLPVILPVFYRLSVADLYNEPQVLRKGTDGKSLYETTRFFARRDNGEPEADVDIIRGAMRTLHGIMGVENKYYASNELSAAPSRVLLLRDVCEMVLKVIGEHTTRTTVNEGPSNAFRIANAFQPCFNDEPLCDIVLDFASVDAHGEPLTDEGRIKRRILNFEGKSQQLVAIVGGGGVGKSTILKGLGNDEGVRQRFSDGVHMLSLGMEATVAILLRELCRVLRDSGAVKTEERLRSEKDIDYAIREALRETISWFKGKSCAFLIDDVWTSKISAKPFSQLFNKLGGADQQSAVVFTTRELEIASLAPRASIFRVTAKEAVGTESWKILLSHAGVTEDNASDVYTKASIVETLKICNGLPVSLAAAGKGVKMLTIGMNIPYGDVWTEYLMSLREYREQLLQENVSDYGNLYTTFRASIALLERRKEDKLGFETPASFGEMHRRLCVLRKQGKAPASMLRHLWKLKSEQEARVVGMKFVEVGLAESHTMYRPFEINLVWCLGLHDSLHDFATTEAKRHGDLVHGHEILLDGYSRSHPDLFQDGETKWDSEHLDYDGYIHENLCRHIWEAGRVLDLKSGELAELKWRKAVISYYEGLKQDTIRAMQNVTATMHMNARNRISNLRC